MLRRVSFGPAADTVKEKVEGAADTVKEKAHEAGDAAKENWEKAKGNAEVGARCHATWGAPRSLQSLRPADWIHACFSIHPNAPCRTPTTAPRARPRTSAPTSRARPRWVLSSLCCPRRCIVVVPCLAVKGFMGIRILSYLPCAGCWAAGRAQGRLGQRQGARGLRRGKGAPKQPEG